jgi:hypothetical protein
LRSTSALGSSTHLVALLLCPTPTFASAMIVSSNDTSHCRRLHVLLLHLSSRRRGPTSSRASSASRCFTTMSPAASSAPRGTLRSCCGSHHPSSCSQRTMTDNTPCRSRFASSTRDVGTGSLAYASRHGSTLRDGWLTLITSYCVKTSRWVVLFNPFTGNRWTFTYALNSSVMAIVTCLIGFSMGA